MITRICGTDFERMLRNGLNNLKAHETEVNNLNVFPVPDGDTGTNMRLTLENGLKNAPSCRPSGAYLKALTNGMLRGARGNSGVILSQLFRGIFEALCHNGWVNSLQLREALIRAYKCAYAAVIKPAEGTLLTVSRMGIEKIRLTVDRNTPVDVLFQCYLDSMKKALQKTPEMLTVLKEAGVVDSGAAGYVYIVEGMVMALRGETVLGGTSDEPELQPKSENVPDDSLFNAFTPFSDGYCLEFTLQLMKTEGYNQNFSRESFTRKLQTLGESLAIVRNGDRIRVHIHVMKPESVISYVRGFGEFVSFKLENMQLQHSVRDAKLQKQPHKAFARVAVVNGEGSAKLFGGLGCDVVIDGGRTMNPGAQDFVEAFSRANADVIAVLPDNKNCFMAARQAADLYSVSKIEIIETVNIAEGYYALCMDVPNSDDAAFRISQMREGVQKLSSFAIAEASRDSSFDGIPIQCGQTLVFFDGKICSASEDSLDAVRDAFGKARDAGRDFDSIFVLCRDANDTEGQDGLRALCEEFWPLADVSFLDAGQPVYRYLIGAV